jgi:hypothetical protein
MAAGLNLNMAKQVRKIRDEKSYEFQLLIGLF